MALSKARGLWAALRRRLSLRVILAVLAVVGLYALIGCPLRFFTGLPCPGCGMSRAAFSLVQLHFAEAFRWHPLVYVLPLALPFLLAKKGPLAKPAARMGALVAFAALFIAVYLVRFIFVNGGVVSITQPGLAAGLQKIFS